MAEKASSEQQTAATLADQVAALAAWQRGDLARAEELSDATLARDPTNSAALRLRGVLAYRNGEYTEALRLLQPIAETAADHSNLGAMLRALKRFPEAEAACGQAISLDPGLAAAHHNLGNIHLDQKRFPEAEASFRTALQLSSDYADAWNGLGKALQNLGRLRAAADAFTKSAQATPDRAEPYINLGVSLMGLNHHDEAARVLRRALAVDPLSSMAHGNLGALYLRVGHPVAAEEACHAAIALAPSEHRWLTNLAVAKEAQARHAEAEIWHRKAIALQPDYASGHGNLLFGLGYRSDVSAEAVFAEYQAWDRQHAQPLALPPDSYLELDRTEGRRLRIGYVSPDFREHAVALFAEPLLAAHDRSQVEIHCYAEVAAPDAVTERFQALADHWRFTIGLSDDELAEQIRRDRIDVLIDLAGHSAGNRLLTFARRPAPVQVAYLLGHGYTTGLSAIDAFLADAVLAPEGADALFSERVIRLSRIPLAYAPPDGMPPVAALPAATNGFVTFGYFGRTERLNDQVIAAWARILKATPNARLVLNNRPFQEPAFRAIVAARFAKHSIDADRLQLTYTTPQARTWAAYGEIDIALDPFPHNAGTTTIEALWQGVPVVSLAGRPSVGRFGASILHAIGLDDWVVGDIDAYVARALTAANDPASLAELRSKLRQRVAASPLCDASGLARDIEATCRALWEEWHQHDPEPLHRLYQAGDRAGTHDLAYRILEHDPANVEAHHVLGLLAFHDKRLAEADRHLATAITRAQNRAELHANHAAVLRSQGRLADAEGAARCALELDTRCIGAHNNLGNVLRDAGRFAESADCYRTAVQLDPRFTDSWVNLAWVLALAGHAQQAEEAALHAIECSPCDADAYNNLGLALMRQGRLAEAEAALRQALALRPAFALPHSNILFCLNYRPDISAQEVFAEYRRWDQQHALPLMPADPSFDLDRTTGRRLRVGYVSPDFRQHAVALFAEPLLAAHDRISVEVYCYAEVPAPDAVTERFRNLAHHWCSTVGLSDAEVADQIRRDKIDVLIDLAGHTAGNRLLVFARKPAPVQVTWLLGHGYSSGLTAMDAFLADTELAPAGADALFSERVVRLSRIPLAYAPPTDMPDVSPLPARTAGHVTFGYFGRTVRLNDGVLTAWAQILHAVPGSRLMLNSAPFGEAAGRVQMTARCAALGIDPERLELIYTTPQTCTWAAYSQVDIALDPFPHNAGTTTIEALWQGVPVVSLAGRPTVGRFGAAILRAVGLDDWVTDDIHSYVARAVSAASDLVGLDQLRATLRQRVAASPLRDPDGLAREVEDAYRALWQAWCDGDAAQLRTLYETGDLNRASELAERMLAHNPSDAFALHILGLAEFSRGDPGRAATLLQRSIDIKPDPAVLSDFGVVLRASGRFGEAEAAYRQALALNPSLLQALGNLGNVLLDQHRADEADTVLTEALQHAPDEPRLLHSLGLSLMARGEADRAEAALRQALRCDPDNAEAHETLGALLGRTGRPIEAEAHHRAALPQMRDRHRGLSNLAVVLQTQGRHAEAELCCREALALRPEYVAAQSNLLFWLNYRSELAAEEIFAAYRDWGGRHAAALAPAEPKFRCDRTAGRQLRIGYVSADFRQHAVAWFAEPLLAAHDRTCVELFCYAEVASPDATTERFRVLADHWRSTVGMSDAAVADMIRHDGIDVLVDLTGHTAGNRMLVFARKPAPVQVISPLGHGYTSGLPTMDGFLADLSLVPPGAETLFSERIMRLPRIPLAYAPPDEMPPVGPLHALENGRVSFGYFGRPERLNDDVVAAWSRILHAVPGSRLVLNSAPYREEAFRELVAERFVAQGIERDRLELIATAPQPRTWAAYGAIDIALDPFPHNAGTTTIEALWLGVPVASLAGRPSVGRFGAMILHAVEMDEWVSDTLDDYVAHAVEAAADLKALAQLRAELRPRVARSPLCDAAGLARSLEAAYREFWDEWRLRC